MDEAKNSEQKHRKGKKKSALPLLLALLLLIGGLAAWHFLGGRNQDEVMEPNAVVGTMPGKSKEQIEAELTQEVKEKEIAFSINANPNFETGDSKGNLLFENPQSNKKLTRVEIYLDDTDELIYKSGLLEPGSYIPQVKLLRDLDAGSYSCTAVIHAYKQADKSYVGKVAAGLTVTVKG